MLRANPGIFAIACDLSPIAIDLLQQKEDFKCGRCFAFSCDVSRYEQPSPNHNPLLHIVPNGVVDFVTLFHVLCAIHPARHRYFEARRLPVLSRSGHS
eukprot:gnl/MRDRNA2_/MRDRNA2_6666_c0_seq2.p1 gnl/MRDRNA2_/MRDRNA2_6666_c0~~gnl/MRDRNA2_/MRDRNA2_6666_c0_seq2.p1  ORF type:complete len:107 (+),score=5.20 gnl/MRDRNA2_/MRDRNA2_6666_c0_seq2:28-321(+)